MPVDIQGKTYYTVAERLTLAHGEDVKPAGIKSISTSVEAHGNLVVVVAMVTFADGRFFTGMSMVNADSRSPAERSAPLETCETSAVGRALAMAGYFGSPEGIAGAEELELAQKRSEARAQRVIQPQRAEFFDDGAPPAYRSDSGAAPRPVGGGGGAGASASQVRYASKLWGDAGRPLPPPNFPGMTSSDISRLIDDLKAEAAR